MAKFFNIVFPTWLSVADEKVQDKDDYQSDERSGPAHEEHDSHT